MSKETYCRECGKKIKQDIGFCPYCGTPVSSGAQEEYGDYDAGGRGRGNSTQKIPYGDDYDDRNYNGRNYNDRSYDRYNDDYYRPNDDYYDYGNMSNVSRGGGPWKILAIVMAVIIALGLIGGVIWFIVSHGDDDDKDKKDSTTTEVTDDEDDEDDEDVDYDGQNNNASGNTANNGNTSGGDGYQANNNANNQANNNANNNSGYSNRTAPRTNYANEQGIIFSNSSSTKLSAGAIESLPDRDLQDAINEIYARHGHIFDDPQFTNKYRSYDWYYPDHKVSESEFNSAESYNMDIMTKERKYRRENGYWTL